MGGALDSARFKRYLSLAAKVNINDVDGMVIGGHGDTFMIPHLEGYDQGRARFAVPLRRRSWPRWLPHDGGRRYAHQAHRHFGLVCSGAAASFMVESIIKDQKKMIPCSCHLEGEYGESGLCIGVPAIIGRKGIEKIVEIEPSAEEKEKFAASAAAVKKVNNVLHEINAI